MADNINKADVIFTKNKNHPQYTTQGFVCGDRDSPLERHGCAALFVNLCEFYRNWIMNKNNSDYNFLANGCVCLFI